ncbi:MAG: hybrid sensor histidine kinase/response regulator [Methanoregulaceae archaeon]
MAEDSRTQAEYLRHILETSGYRVVLAENGREALDLIATEKPALVMTDVVMPEMDGYELCSVIKQDETTARIPVILVTQLFDPLDVIRGLESGADNFIIKPYDPAYIISRIESTLAAMDQPESKRSATGPEIFLEGPHIITSGRLPILNTLLSTYEIAVRKNTDLVDAQEQLSSLNDQLQQVVAELQRTNTELVQENTERRRVEKELADANKKLRLLASITRHDLFNQITTLQEYLELSLLTRERNPESAWNHVASASGTADRMVNTIRFAGEYQKIGIAHPVWQEIRTLVKKSEQYTSHNQVSLDNLLPESVEVYADPLIEKVFSNLIENAVRYGEKITTIRFSLRKDGDSFIILCEDDGIGITVEEKEKIFSYEYGLNTGLGLFLSREILGITGITIRETGEPEKGARFEIGCPSGNIREIQIKGT